MFKNYITTAFRNLLRNKLYSFTNIGGLAIGLATSMLIGLFVIYELSYDRWLPGADQIYKVEYSEVNPGHEPIITAKSPSPLAQALVKDYGGIEAAVRLTPRSFTVRQGENQFNESVFLADPSFFEVFDLPIELGSKEEFSKSQNGIAISEDMAKKYFGDRPAVGEVLTLNGAVDHVVVAVFKNIPGNTHFDTDFITLFNPNPESQYYVTDHWGSDSVHTYIKVGPGFDLNILETDQKGFAERNITLIWTDLPPADLMFFNLIAITDIHLYSGKTNHEMPVSEIKTVVTFAIIAFMILALAAINFTNLATAQALKRAREVSMRKVLGASRKQVIRQFLGEAIFTSLIAFILALGLAELAMPFYNSFLGMELTLSSLAEPILALGLFGLVLLTGLIGGAYPALVLSGFRPSAVLRSRQAGNEAKPWFRNSLVVFQFSVAIALIAATSVVYIQTQFVRTVDIGFSPQGKLSIPVNDDRAASVAGALKEQFGRIQGVNKVAQINSPLPMTDGPLVSLVPPDATRDQAELFSTVFIDPNFFNLLDQEPLAGRWFDAARPVDFRNAPEDVTKPITRGAVLNETGITLLGFNNPEEAVGKIITMPDSRGDTLVTIVGVASDTHLDSLYSTIKPTVFYVTYNTWGYILVDFEKGEQDAVLAGIGQLWNNLLPGVALAPSFLEDEYAALYREADRQGDLFAIFAGFAIFVASLGLYGLAGHMAKRRTKEIGIRKVLGARVRDIIGLLTWQFSKLVVIAAPLGIFASVWAMFDWLNGFAYRISLVGNSWVFIAAAVVAFFIAWATVGTQAARAARKNPVISLNSE
ncbi:MAG: FtsX-like permease family protein [Sphingomonadales bacterium]